MISPLNIFSHAARVRKKTEQQLEMYSKPSVSFFVLILLSTAIATFGLILDSASVIIGAMVVAPLLTPIFAFSLALIILRTKQVFQSLLLLFAGTVLSIGISFICAYTVSFIDGTPLAFNEEILSRTDPNFLYFLVALVSGMAGAYTYAKPNLKESIAGIAIAVALVPPLAVTGIGIAGNNVHVFLSSLLLYTSNLLGISFGSILIFILLGFGKEIE